MTNIEPQEFITADWAKFSKQNGEYFVKTTTNNTLVTEKFNYISIDYPNNTTEIYTYKLGGASGNTVATITITYVNSSKALVSSILRT